MTGRNKVFTARAENLEYLVLAAQLPYFLRIPRVFRSDAWPPTRML